MKERVRAQKAFWHCRFFTRCTRLPRDTRTVATRSDSQHNQRRRYDTRRMKNMVARILSRVLPTLPMPIPATACILSYYRNPDGF